jgi:Na+/H+-dicarboxylate symporter
VTTAIAITVGLVLANVVAPGGASATRPARCSPREARRARTEKIADASAARTPGDVLLDIVPQNPFTALADTAMLQVVFAALLIGIALTRLPDDKANP